MEVTTQDVFDWLERQYHNYKVHPEPLHGTYGLIWFLSADSGSFAVKTLAPERLSVAASRFDAEYLRREFRIWLSLPPTYNVLSALGFDIASLGSAESQKKVHLPVMRMPRRLGSLQDWVDSRIFSYEDRLVALAQAFNGLMYLYAHGIEGHGDLKPSNILYDDLRSLFALPEDGAWPNQRCPWRIQVADLGWADAWVDLGFTKKAQRQYLAPERMDGKVIPELSDMFSMGIIAAEVLQGRHPCSNLSKVLGSEGKWRRWIYDGERDLSGIASTRTKDLISQCLSPNPDDRPPPCYCFNEICSEIELISGFSIAKTLELWRRPAAGTSSITEEEHAAWAAAESVKLNEEQASISRRNLETRLNQLRVCDFETCERWQTLATGLEKLLNKDEGDADALAALRKHANALLLNILGPMTSNDLAKATPRQDWSTQIRPFERFAEVTGNMVRLAGLDLQTILKTPFCLGNHALSAIAFRAASEARWSGASVDEVNQLLNQAIRFLPEQSVPYYFRARWGRDTAITSEALHKIRGSSDQDKVSDDEIQSWVGDLEKALESDPDWQEAADLLNVIRTRQR